MRSGITAYISTDFTGFVDYRWARELRQGRFISNGYVEMSRPTLGDVGKLNTPDSAFL
jgi:hypothetical protein